MREGEREGGARKPDWDKPCWGRDASEKHAEKSETRESKGFAGGVGNRMRKEREEMAEPQVHRGSEHVVVLHPNKHHWHFQNAWPASIGKYECIHSRRVLYYISSEWVWSYMHLKLGGGVVQSLQVSHCEVR